MGIEPTLVSVLTVWTRKKTALRAIGVLMLSARLVLSEAVTGCPESRPLQAVKKAADDASGGMRASPAATEQELAWLRYGGRGGL
jgi:hypothetical protein